MTNCKICMLIIGTVEKILIAIHDPCQSCEVVYNLQLFLEHILY